MHEQYLSGLSLCVRLRWRLCICICGLRVGSLTNYVKTLENEVQIGYMSLLLRPTTKQEVEVMAHFLRRAWKALKVAGLRKVRGCINEELIISKNC